MYKNYLDDETGMSAGPPSHRVHCSNQETGEEFVSIFSEPYIQDLWLKSIIDKKRSSLWDKMHEKI